MTEPTHPDMDAPSDVRGYRRGFQDGFREGCAAEPDVEDAYERFVAGTDEPPWELASEVRRDQWRKVVKAVVEARRDGINDG